MDNCVFCRIISGEIPSMRVYEDEGCIAALDISPASPGHTLIIPKVHHQDLTELSAAEIEHFFSVAKLLGLRQLERLQADGFNLVQNIATEKAQGLQQKIGDIVKKYKLDMQKPSVTDVQSWIDCAQSSLT